jgi:hypothetical protein
MADWSPGPTINRGATAPFRHPLNCGTRGPVPLVVRVLGRVTARGPRSPIRTLLQRPPTPAQTPPTTR